MNTTFTINVQGEIRLPDIALLAQALMGRPQPEAMTAPRPTAPTPAPQPAVNPTPMFFSRRPPPITRRRSRSFP